MDVRNIAFAPALGAGTFEGESHARQLPRPPPHRLRPVEDRPQDGRLAGSTRLDRAAGHRLADTFTFTGAEQSYVVPDGTAAVRVDATGAAGEGGTGGTGGRGATVSGTLAVIPGQTLYVEVGGVGECNGAGLSEQETSGGGGAADVRTISATDSGGSFCGTPFDQSTTSLNSRLIVAGGGGAGGSFGNGGDAGQDGSDGSGGGKAGTDSQGGAGGTATNEAGIAGGSPRRSRTSSGSRARETSGTCSPATVGRTS